MKFNYTLFVIPFLLTTCQSRRQLPKRVQDLSRQVTRSSSRSQRLRKFQVHNLFKNCKLGHQVLIQVTKMEEIPVVQFVEHTAAWICTFVTMMVYKCDIIVFITTILIESTSTQTEQQHHWTGSRLKSWSGITAEHECAPLWPHHCIGSQCI